MLAITGQVASADVDVERASPLADAQLDRPVRHRRPRRPAPADFRLPQLHGRDPLPNLVQGEGEPGLQGAQAWQVGWEVGHVGVFSGSGGRRDVERRSGLGAGDRLQLHALFHQVLAVERLPVRMRGDRLREGQALLAETVHGRLLLVCPAR